MDLWATVKALVTSVPAQQPLNRRQQLFIEEEKWLKRYAASPSLPERRLKHVFEVFRNTIKVIDYRAAANSAPNARYNALVNLVDRFTKNSNKLFNDHAKLIGEHVERLERSELFTDRLSGDALGNLRLLAAKNEEIARAILDHQKKFAGSTTESWTDSLEKRLAPLFRHSQAFAQIALRDLESWSKKSEQPDAFRANTIDLATKAAIELAGSEEDAELFKEMIAFTANLKG